MKKHLTKRLLSLVIVLAMCLAMAVPGFAVTETGGYTIEKVDKSAVPADLFNRTEVGDIVQQTTHFHDSEQVRVSIVLGEKSTMETAADRGLSLSAYLSDSGLVSYRAKLLQNQQAMAARISDQALGGDELDVVWNLTLAANIISANVLYGQIDEIEKVAGVAEVFVEPMFTAPETEQGTVNPSMATSTNQIGSTAAWLEGYTGAGSRISVIDTGTDLGHQSFSNEAFLYALADNAEKAGMEYEAYVDSLDLLDLEEIEAVFDQLNISQLGFTAEDLYINEKHPFAFSYVDRDCGVAHDAEPHGSHVAGIAAANRFIPSGEGFVDALSTVFVQGVAPDAQLITMQVFGSHGGASASDFMAAIEDSIVLNCDSANLSLGSDVPGFADAGEYQDIMDALSSSDTLVVCAMGNAGYWSEYDLLDLTASIPQLLAWDVNFFTGGFPASYGNSLAVASSDNEGFTALHFTVDGTNLSYIENLYDVDDTPFGNRPFTTIAGEQEYVFLNSIGTAEEFEAIKDVVEGKVALCFRGETDFTEKANAAMSAGAIGLIVVNNQPGAIYMTIPGYKYTAPVASILQTCGELFKSAGTAVTGEDGSVLYWTGSMVISDDLGIGSLFQMHNSMSDFSSWGVPGDLSMKPEITAPGGEIYSVHGTVPSTAIGGTDKYVTYSGTSMATPQIAGMTALLMQYIRENDLSVDGLTDRALAQSLLMSTAVPMIDGSSGCYYPILQQGSGQANIYNAISAETYILMNADATDSWADGKVKVELGDDPDKTGTYQFSFSVNNLTDEEQTYTLNADFFTQDLFVNSGLIFLDTLTTPIAANVTWTVDGQTVELDPTLDFNGDGRVNEDDGQAILDYATGARDFLYFPDFADLDADGDVDSHDAYCFLSELFVNAITVPANGSVNVTVDVQLTDMFWLSLYENGAYVEGFVFVDPITTEEGVVRTGHSIPVLGFYGNWTDPSMYDDYNIYAYGGDLVSPKELTTNYLTADYYGLGEYLFGGNPFMADPTYMPERDALSPVNGDALGRVVFTPIRSAGRSLLMISDHNTGEIYGMSEGEEIYSTYFSLNSISWEYATQSADLRGWNGYGLPNNTTVDVSLVLIPEYYADDEFNYDIRSILPRLGKGAFQTYTMTIDSEEPAIKDGSLVIDEDAGTLTVSVSDNQYVAYVALLNDSCTKILVEEGSKADAVAGGTVEYTLDITDVNGLSFYLGISDYAGNLSMYRISQKIGEMTENIDGVVISDERLTLAKGRSTLLIAEVTPSNTLYPDIVWSSSDESVATVDSTGVVTALKEGTATITAAAAKNTEISASCLVTVAEIDYTLEGALLDEDAKSFSYTWDLEHDSALTMGEALQDINLGSACGLSSPYAFIFDSNDYSISIVNLSTGQNLGGGASCPIPYWDMSLSALVDGNQNPLIHGIYEGWVFLAQNPAAPSASGYDLSSFLQKYSGATAFVGITSLGVYTDGTDLFELIYALDDNGYMWSLFFYFGTGNLKFNFAPTDLPADFDLSYDFGYSSMVLSDDEEFLFVSQFDGDASQIYMLDADDLTSIHLGSTDTDVWPAALTGAYSNAPASSADTDTNEFLDVQSAAQFELTEKDVQTMQLPAEGGVRSVSASSLSDAASAAVAAAVGSFHPDDVDVIDDKLVMDIKAKDNDGDLVASNNGLIVVDYDPAAMTFHSLAAYTDYISYVVDEVNGTVTIGYVDLAGLPINRAIASLQFDTLANGEHAEVHYHQYNNVDTDCTHKLGHAYCDWYSSGNSNAQYCYCVMCGQSDIRFTGNTGSNGLPAAPSTEHNCAADRFSDLDSSAWYHAAVDFVVARGIMNGTGTGSTFSPYMNLSRAMMMTMLARLDGVNTNGGATWYEIGMKWAMEKGISDGTNPNADITREQLVTMLYRYAGSPAVSTNNYLASYADGASVSIWAKDAMNWAISMGIIQGNGNGLNPQGLATRAEVAQIFYNYLGR